VREAVEGAIYEWREQTVAVRVPGEPQERLAAVLAVAGALRDAQAADERPAGDMLPTS
jgi:hypothetical protein